MLLYDNIDDVKSKLVGTFVYYNKEVYFVKDAIGIVKYKLMIQPKHGKTQWVDLDDPLLNYTVFNLGYANYGEFTAWWCRTPAKQFQQGLKSNQLRYYWGHKEFQNEFLPSIQFNKPTIEMLQNVYPTFSEASELVSSGETRSRAFHKDFALSWDKVHSDFIIDHKGRHVGHIKNDGDIILMDEFKYLTESIKEVAL